MCIIESPDGAQCGLILFLCKECQITTQVKSERDEVQARLNKCRKTLGIQIRSPDCPKESKRQEAAIVVDGIITGYVDVMYAVEISDYLRKKKKIILVFSKFVFFSVSICSFVCLILYNNDNNNNLFQKKPVGHRKFT